MLNSRNLEDLTFETAAKALAFIAGCEEKGIEILITSTLRDFESQRALYAQGRTKPGRIVTNADAGFSYHNYGVAFDFVPIVNGKCIWNDDQLWAKCGLVAREVGLEWGGHWKFEDKPHCQNTGGQTIADLRANVPVSQFAANGSQQQIVPVNVGA